MTLLRKNWSDRNRDLTSLNLVTSIAIYDRFTRLAERLNVNPADLAGRALAEFVDRQETSK